MHFAVFYAKNEYVDNRILYQMKHESQEAFKREVMKQAFLARVGPCSLIWLGMMRRVT